MTVNIKTNRKFLGREETPLFSYDSCGSKTVDLMNSIYDITGLLSWWQYIKIVIWRIKLSLMYKSLSSYLIWNRDRENSVEIPRYKSQHSFLNCLCSWTKVTSCNSNNVPTRNVQEIFMSIVYNHLSEFDKKILFPKKEWFYLKKWVSLIKGYHYKHITMKRIFFYLLNGDLYFDHQLMSTSWFSVENFRIRKKNYIVWRKGFGSKYYDPYRLTECIFVLNSLDHKLMFVSLISYLGTYELVGIVFWRFL